MSLFKFDKNLSSPNTVKEFLYQSWYRGLGQSLNIKFWSFFITGIVVFGGCGIWVEVSKLLLSSNLEKTSITVLSNSSEKSLAELNKSIIFYITTVLGAACSQILLDRTITPVIKSGTWLLIILIYFLTAAVGFIQSAYKETTILVILIILCSISLSIVWLINTFNNGLTDIDDSKDSIGGVIDEKVKSLFHQKIKIDSDGFKV